MRKTSTGAARLFLCIMSFLAMCSSVTGQERGLGPGGAVSESEPYVAQGGDNAPFDCTCTKIEIKVEEQEGEYTIPLVVGEGDQHVRRGRVQWWMNGDSNSKLCIEVKIDPPETAVFRWLDRPGGTQPFLQSDTINTNCEDGWRDFEIKGWTKPSPTVLGSKMTAKIYRGPCPPSGTDPICRRDIRFTVLKVDLDGDSEDDGDVDDDDDVVEETLPVIVAINEDTRELTVRKVGVSSGGTLKIKKTGTGKLTLKKPDGATVLGENDAESVDFLPDAGTADLVLTLDGTAVGDVDLELEFASGSFTCSDPFKVKVVRSDVVQRSGNTFLAALIGEARTHSGVDWQKYVTDLYDPGIERISLATYESLADGGPDKKRLRVKKTLYMARRVWAKVYDNMDAQAYTLPTSAHPWNLFTTSTNYSTANCNELITEQFRRAITEVRGELTKPAQQTAFESTWYSGGTANTPTAGKHLVLFPGKSPMAGPTIFLMQTALNYRSKCVGATTQFQNDYEGEILIFFFNGTRYTAGSSCSICGAGTSYPYAPWYVIPFLELWDEAHHSTITPDSFVGSSFFEEITY
jgi:hypothetical protein